MVLAFRKILRTFQLMFYALLPDAGAGPPVAVSGEAASVEPKELRLGLDRFLDHNGELRVLFGGCLGIAAPFVLFRLKRRGFSRCSVRVSKRGLLVEARR